MLLVSMVAEQNREDDQTWYTDTGATHHITVTSDLANLTLQSEYHGNDTVQVGNGQGLSISHTGSSLIHTPYSSFQLNNILYCPKASHNLLFVQKFSKDNNCFFYFDDTGFIVKDKQSGKILFQGQLNKGLYPLHASRTSNKISHASFVSLYISSEIWHHRLGHLSATIQQAIFSNNSSIMSKIKDTKSICTSCQHGKSKKLSFSLSSHVSSKPLELIHSDV